MEGEVLEGVFRLPYILGFCTARYGYPRLMGKWSQLTIYRDHVLCPQIFCRGREKVRGRENGGLQGNDVM